MKYIIVGQSVTAIKFIEELRKYDPEAQVTGVSFDGSLPVFPERFPELFARQITRKDVQYQNENFYRNLRVELITDKKISRINFNRRTVFFDDKSSLEADFLIIAGSEKDQFPDIKGVVREGVFSLRTYAQVDQLLNMINRIDTVMVESSSMTGVLFSLSLASQDKEVIFNLPLDRLWPDVLNNDTSNFIISLMENSGIRVMRRGKIQEILGEADVKAVRLNTGKVIAVEVVIFPDATPDVRMYARSGIEAQARIKTDELLRTNFANVFAVDDMAQEFLAERRLSHPDDFRQNQIMRLLKAMTQSEDVTASEFNRVFHFEIAGHIVSTFGRLTDPDAEVYVKIREDGFLEKYIMMKNKVVQGGLLVNNSNVADELWQLFQSRQEADVISHEQLADCVLKTNSIEDSQVIVGQEDEAGLDSMDQPGLADGEPSSAEESQA